MRQDFKGGNQNTFTCFDQPKYDRSATETQLFCDGRPNCV